MDHKRLFWPNKHLPAGFLLKYFLNNGLEKIYQETVRLIRPILIFPVSTASSERSMSALKRVKTFLRNSMSDSRLSNLSTLAIEKSLLNSLFRDYIFKERIIDIYAEQKNTPTGVYLQKNIYVYNFRIPSCMNVASPLMLCNSLCL